MYQILRYILFDGAYVVGDNEKFISRFAAFDDFVADNVGDKLAENAHTYGFVVERTRFRREYKARNYRNYGVYEKRNVKKVETRIFLVYESRNDVHSAARTLFSEKYSVSKPRDNAG